jgi:tRNA/tmRNA/rRNA uracil-C5-methylase (TrmA/RlmC/RlmD family)
VWENEKQRFAREVTAIKLEFPVRSLFVQEYNGVSSPPVDHPREKIWGADFIEEVICGLTFRVSPDAFFQVSSARYRSTYQASHLK